MGDEVLLRLASDVTWLQEELLRKRTEADALVRKGDHGANNAVDALQTVCHCRPSAKLYSGLWVVVGCFVLGVRVGHTGRGHTHRGSASRWDGSSRNLPAVFGSRHRDVAEFWRGPIHLEPDTAQRCPACT